MKIGMNDKTGCAEAQTYFNRCHIVKSRLHRILYPNCQEANISSLLVIISG